MPDAVALFDSVGYTTEDGDTFYATKGETFTASQKEIDRLKGMGAAASAGSDDAKAMLGEDAEAGPVAGAADEAELKKLSLEKLREHATEAGVDGADRMSKPQLVNAVRARGALGNLPPA